MLVMVLKDIRNFWNNRQKLNQFFFFGDIGVIFQRPELRSHMATVGASLQVTQLTGHAFL